MKKIEIWDVIIWVSLLVLIGYVIAKLTGLINTPEWINLIPIITLIFFAGAFYQKVLGFMEIMNHRTSYLKNNLDKAINKLEEHDEILFTLTKTKK
ncbi:hypothetical protein J4462_00730 [Candidatus Pacearchaeota archaeon]|nr:hypothetical protein [Candidatus Pacearchaeota archaeon]